MPGSKLLSSLITGILTHSWALVDALLRYPEILKLHIPMLPHTKAIEYATGMKMDFGTYFRVGERGYTLERLYNIREGIGGSEDRLPKRFTEEQLLPGNKHSVVPMGKMLPKYYRLRGWDRSGVPTRKTLLRLGLDGL